MPPLTPDQALLRMADLCARSEQCSFDIARKLRLRGLSSSEITYVVTELADRGFIDDRRYARAFANDKVRFSGWGRMKIRAALVAKRIPGDAVTEALGSLDEEEYSEAARRAARAKAASLDLSLYADRIKLARHIISRGFESSLASRIVNELSRT